jgi:hypothetical protein
MAYDFPTSPVDGQTANGYTWNGYAWARAGGGGAIITDGDKGDVIVAGSGTTWTLDPAVTTSINNKVAKAGDTMSGALTASSLNLTTGGGFAKALTNYNLITDPDGIGGIFLGNTTAPTNFYANAIHGFNNRAGTTRFVTIDASKLDIPLNTPSTSPTTGALTVAGGVGISGAASIGGKTYFNGADSAWVATYPPALGVKYVPASAAGITIRPTTDVGSAIIFTNAAGTSVGSVGTTATNATYYTSSDGRLKDCLEEFDAGAMIDRLEAGTFRWKVNGERDYGVVAQDAVKVLPQAVTHDEKHDWWGIDYSKFVPLLLAEVKALRARLAEVEGRVLHG